MTRHDYPPSFPLRLALKDARLAMDAAAPDGPRLGLLEAVAGRFAEAIAAGHAEQDMSAVYEVVRAVR